MSGLFNSKKCKGYRWLLPQIEEKFDPYNEEFRRDFNIDGIELVTQNLLRRTKYKDHLLEELFDDLDSNNDKILTNSEFISISPYKFIINGIK